MTDFARQLVASAMLHDPAPTERIAIARMQLKIAADCLRADPPDLSAAQALVTDVLDHIDAVSRRQRQRWPCDMCGGSGAVMVHEWNDQYDRSHASYDTCHECGGTGDMGPEEDDGA